VEQKISKWSGVVPGETVYVEKEPGGKKKRIDVTQLYEDVCWQCGQKTQVKFMPDGKRPIYCPECLQKIRAASQPAEGLAVRQPMPSRDISERKLFPAAAERRREPEQRLRIERRPPRMPRRPERVGRSRPARMLSDGELATKEETRTISLDEATKNNPARHVLRSDTEGSVRNVAHIPASPSIPTGESKKPAVEVDLGELRKTLRGVLFGEEKEEKKERGE
jgi:CxxC-x17-CxxC domain-containing protein